RADVVLPSGRRIVTDPFLPTTWTLVRIVSGATKNPLPKLSAVSTRTTAGIARLMTSSREEGAAAGTAATGGTAASVIGTAGAAGESALGGTEGDAGTGSAASAARAATGRPAATATGLLAS